MRQLASETGGLAYYNRNDLDRAIRLGVAHGSQYYVLGYYPSDTNWNGRFRRIQVKVDRRKIEVQHRLGYYANDPSRPAGPRPQGYDELWEAITHDPMPSTAVTFLSHLSVGPPAVPAEVNVDFSVDPETLSFPDRGNGRHHCDVEFQLAAFSSEGRLLQSELKTLKSDIDQETYSKIVKGGLPLRLTVSLPPGRYGLRLGVRNKPTARIGTTIVPLILGKPHT